ncbi:MAG: TIGR03905 family TSCPD domain-containing protein [Floccifex sp.]
MSTYQYKPSGVCSSQFIFDIEDGVIQKLVVKGGCPGNLLGISRLVQGRSMESVIQDLKGVRCGAKPTSCPDQIARALEAIMEKENG